jgi:PAS domain S-box-containing protein
MIDQVEFPTAHGTGLRAMPKQFMVARPGFGDRLRLMAFSIIILLTVALAAVVVTVFHFRVFPQTSHEQATRLAAVESLVFVVAGSLLLVRVCNPFLRRLEESDARVRAIVTLAGDGIITVDHEGTIETFNLAAERMFRTSQEAVVGRSIDALLLLPSGTSFQQALAEQDLEHFQGHPGDALGRRQDGARFPVELSTSHVPLEERSICTVIVRDVTERDAAARQMRTQMLKLQEVKENLEAKAAELAKINRELDDFTYIASHDLKEPLRGISSYCQILLEDYSGKLDDDGQRRLESLVGLCQRLSRLIDDLLTYSQIGRTEPETAPIDLNEIVGDVIDTLGAAIDERNAIVRVKGSLPTVEADRVLVGEVFRNLIANALKFNENPLPAVEIGHDGNAVYVRDNGIGIPECHHEAVFTMFRRLHSRRKYEGTGAGLTFVRKIVEAHGGAVWLESQPDCGATFYFTLSAEPAYAGQEPACCAVG